LAESGETERQGDSNGISYHVTPDRGFNSAAGTAPRRE